MRLIDEKDVERAKYDMELDKGLYEYVEAHKNDIPTFRYAF